MRRISIPQVRRKFGFATHARQTFAIAWTSFSTIAKGATGLLLWAAITILVILLMPLLMNLGGVPLPVHRRA
jgi:ABC-2 type transport system permease protein